MHHERYHVFGKMNCRRKVCHLHQSNMSKKQMLHRMHCITLAGTMNAKPTSNFELIVMQQRNHRRKKQVEQNLLNQKHCKNSTHTNLQVQQRTSNWQVRFHPRTCGHWTVNRETLNKEQCTMRGIMFSGRWTAEEKFATCTSPTCQKNKRFIKWTASQWQAPWMQNQLQLWTISFQPMVMLLALFSNLHLKDAPFKLFFCRFSRKHVRKPCSLKAQWTQNSGTVHTKQRTGPQCSMNQGPLSPTHANRPALAALRVHCQHWQHRQQQQQCYHQPFFGTIAASIAWHPVHHRCTIPYKVLYGPKGIRQRTIAGWLLSTLTILADKSKHHLHSLPWQCIRQGNREQWMGQNASKGWYLFGKLCAKHGNNGQWMFNCKSLHCNTASNSSTLQQSCFWSLLTWSKLPCRKQNLAAVKQRITLLQRHRWQWNSEPQPLLLQSPVAFHCLLPGFCHVGRWKHIHPAATSFTVIEKGVHLDHHLPCLWTKSVNFLNRKMWGILPVNLVVHCPMVLEIFTGFPQANTQPLCKCRHLGVRLNPKVHTRNQRWWRRVGWFKTTLGLNVA